MLKSTNTRTVLFLKIIWYHMVHGILFLNQGSNLCPLHWEQGVLTTALPEKSSGTSENQWEQDEFGKPHM